MELGYFDFVCEVSDRRWTGYQARLGQNRLFLHPIAHPGFQGWRYVSARLRAKLDELETECSCEPLTPPTSGSKQRAVAIAKLEVERVPVKGQITFLEDVLQIADKKNEFVIASASGRRNAEDLSEYLKEQGFDTWYFHREISPADRVRIAKECREHGDTAIVADILETLPRPSTMVILDADQDCELRTADWIAYHAAHAAKRVIICADTITPALHAVFPRLR